MSEQNSQSLPVALLFGDADTSNALRDALRGMGVRLVWDHDIEALDSGALVNSGAEVVLVSLDSVVDRRFDEVYAKLDEDRYRVLFDDPDISNQLDGWEQARWKRHLAAKLRDLTDWDPPRPAGQALPEEAPEPRQSTAPEAAQADASSSSGEESVIPAPDADGPQHTEAHPSAEPFDAGLNLDFADPGPTADVDEPPAKPVQDSNPPPVEPPVVEPPVADESSADAPTLAMEPPSSPAAEPVPPTDAPASLPPNSLDEDPDLAAELDALADADDPLAALSALAAGKHQEPDITADHEPKSVTSEPAEPQSLESSDDNRTDDEEDWGALEAELNAAFDNETLSSIDAAGRDAESPDAEIAPWEQTAAPSLESEPAAGAVEPVAEVDLSGDDDDADTDAANLTQLVESDETQADSKPESSPAKDASPISDVSQWALVDDDLLDATPNDVTSQAVLGDDSETDEDVDAAAEDTAFADEGADENAFELAILDPVDYIKPEAPKDISNELYNVPDLMDITEAVAPETDDGRGPLHEAEASGVEHIVLLGASLGGPDAVRLFLSCLPERLPATVIVVQHLGSEFLELMVSQLAKSCNLPVHVPARAERAVSGEVLIVPTGSTIELSGDGQIKLESTGGEAPSLRRSMQAVAKTFGERVTAIVFSGMGNDVVDGARAVAEQGGQVWVQDPQSCVVSTMVDAVVQADLSQFAGSPQALAEKLIDHLKETEHGEAH